MFVFRAECLLFRNADESDAFAAIDIRHVGQRNGVETKGRPDLFHYIAVGVVDEAKNSSFFNEFVRSDLRDGKSVMLAANNVA